LTLAFCLAAAVAPPGAAAESTAREYEVKAAFLLNFARLVQWPGAAFADARSPLTVGILSASESSENLEKSLDGKSVGSRKVTARKIASAAEAGDFHLVFVGASAETDARAVADATRGKAVLLVGESTGFVSNGGAINFFTENNKIRFEINPRAAEAAGLRVSSRLLRVAKIVPEGR
jgi:hypothetical protein